MIAAPAPRGESFPPRARLRRKREFERVFRRGWRTGRTPLRLVILENDCGISRLGLAVGKRVGGAVVRNRVKRRLREVFRRERAHFPTTLDVVVVPQAGAGDLSYEELREELTTLISRWRPRPASPDGRGSAGRGSAR